MSFVDFEIDANDDVLAFGGKVVRVFAPTATLPADANLLENDHLWCWPLETTTDASGTKIPSRVDCGGPGNNTCQICASSGCSKGPPPPTVVAVAPPPDGSGDTNRLVMARARTILDGARIRISPPAGWPDGSAFQLGPIIVVADGPLASISSDVLQAMWSAVAGEGRAIKLHVYNVVDPRAYPLTQLPPPTNLHPLHNKVIAIPAVEWSPPAQAPAPASP